MSSTAKQLNDLLQGERAAAETYKQALSKFGTDARADGLREIQSDHIDAVLTLKELVKFQSEEPAKDSGTWGTFAKTVIGSAKLFGDKSALKALKEGEKHGLKEYQELCENDEVQPKVRHLIKTTMIPRQHRHIESIDSIMQQI